MPDISTDSPDGVIVPGEGPAVEPQYPDPMEWFYTTLDGIDFVLEVARMVETGNPWLIGNVVGSGWEFSQSLSGLLNTPSQEQFDLWNAFGANAGIAPGSVYIVTDYDNLRSWFDLQSNSIIGNNAFQLSWHDAVDANDTSGPVIDFF